MMAQGFCIYRKMGLATTRTKSSLRVRLPLPLAAGARPKECARSCYAISFAFMATPQTSLRCSHKNKRCRILDTFLLAFGWKMGLEVRSTRRNTFENKTQLFRQPSNSKQAHLKFLGSPKGCSFFCRLGNMLA